MTIDELITPEEAIHGLRTAVESGSIGRMLQAMSPELQPEWDRVPDYLFDIWDELVDGALELIDGR